MQAGALTSAMLLTGSLAGLAACADAQKPDGPVKTPDYLGVEIAPLADDLVAFRVRLRGSGDATAVEDYARCTAAGYGARGGGGFLRHLRTKTDHQGGIWSADAIYSVSSELPRGLQTIDAEVTVADCQDRAIPTREQGIL